MRKKTHEEFMRDFKEKQPENFKNIDILGEYVNNKTKIKFRCKIDGYEGEVTPGHLLTGTGCPRCSGTERYTTKSFKEKIKEINPNIEIIGEYINTHTKIKCRCLIDGCEWEPTPHNLLKGSGCPMCQINKNKELKTKTHNQFIKEIRMVNPDIEVIDEYINNHTKIKCRCLIDGYEWEATPNNLLSGHGCPRCGGTLKKTHEQFIKEMKEIDPNIEIIGEYVNDKIKIKCRCLIDGHEWGAAPNTLLRGEGCPKCAHNGESWMDRTLYELLLTYDSDAVYREKDTIGMELDSFCPNLNLAFEPGSWHWHQDKVEKDALKRKLCSEKGIRCITIYDKFPENIKVPFEEDCYVYPKDFGQNKEEFFEQMNKLIPKIIGGE